jgi:phosphoribosyl-AMP cyclohydrolase
LLDKLGVLPYFLLRHEATGATAAPSSSPHETVPAAVWLASDTELALISPLARKRSAGFLFFERAAIGDASMELDFEKEGGLIPAIVQDDKNGEVLMLGFMNREAYDLTRKTGFVTFFSRSRKKLWTKGETSGQKLILRDLRTDCDLDALLVRVELDGGAVCHEGYRSCFFRRLDSNGEATVVAERVFTPEELYGKGKK